jgi:hypothetical protein
MDNNWRTEAANDDCNHHHTMQVKRYDHTFSKQELYENTGTLRKTKIWVSFQTPRELSHSKTNEQSGSNAEQIERMNIQRVKLFEE